MAPALGSGRDRRVDPGELFRAAQGSARSLGDLVKALVDGIPDDSGVTVDVVRREVGGAVVAGINGWTSRLEVVVVCADEQGVDGGVSVGSPGPGAGSPEPGGSRTEAVVGNEERRNRAVCPNAFSRKIENHVAAVALHFMHYNFARPHKSLKDPFPRTPAMAAGVGDHIWTLTEIAKLLD